MKIFSMMQLGIKMTLCVFLLLCLLSMPYDYFQLVRFVGMVGFSILAYFSYEQKRNVEVIIYISRLCFFSLLLKLLWEERFGIWWM